MRLLELLGVSCESKEETVPVFDWDAYYKDIADGVDSRIIDRKFKKMSYYKYEPASKESREK